MPITSASLPPDGAYGKPSPPRLLKSQQIQGLTISDLGIPQSFDKRMADAVCCVARPKERTCNVEHEARRVVREGQHGRTDAGKSNPRASASRWEAWLGCGRGLQ